MYKDKDKKRKADRRRYAKRREEMIVFLGNVCIVCGSKENLEIDHIIKTTKTFAISRYYNYRWETLVEELVKCQLLCKLHHDIKNKIDNGEAVHGSLAMYSHHKCRCNLCTETWNTWHRERYRPSVV